MSAILILTDPPVIDLSTVEVVDFRIRFDILLDQYLVAIETQDALGRATNHLYSDDEAKAMIRNVNKRDFSGANKRLRQVVLDQLVSDGKLGAGTTSEDETDLDTP